MLDNIHQNEIMIAMGHHTIVLAGLIVLALCASTSASYYPIPVNFPIVIFTDFKYIPTDYGYNLSYRTQSGYSHEELGIVPGVPPLRNGDRGGRGNSNGGPNDIGSSSQDTLGSSKKDRNKSKSKSRKVAPKLLASLAG